jgi:hypothetical protein
MKKLILVIAIAGLLLSCKKESGGPTVTLLTEIKSDGLIENRMEYNSDNLITKIEGYTLELTNNTVQTYIKFQYNSKGLIKEYIGYAMPGNIPIAKVVIQYDSADKLVSDSYYDLQNGSPATPISTTTYFYNDKGLVNKSVRKNKNGQFSEQVNFIYYADGHLKERQSWGEESGALWMKSKYAYSIPNGYYPTGLEQIRVLVGAEFIGSMHSDAINYKFFDQNGAISKDYNDIMSGREYNADGSLKQQVVTTQYVKPEKDDRAVLREFKYITQ